MRSRASALCCLLTSLLLGLVAGCGPAGAPTGTREITAPTQPVQVELRASATPLEAGRQDLARSFERSGVAFISLLTPTGGSGSQPKFEWRPVTGAARYTLLLLDEAGGAYWAWEGPETSVFLGGGSEAPAGENVGPVLLRPMLWTVMAFDEQGALVGYSPARPIAP